MHTVLPRPTSDLDHTYLRTEDEVFFSVIGTTHTEQYIYGMPYYFPTDNLTEIFGSPIETSIEVDGVPYTKLLNLISSAEYPTFIQENYPQYYFSPDMWRLLMQVEREQVVDVLSPKQVAQSLISRHIAAENMDNPFVYLLHTINNYAPDLLENIGITGSVLLAGHIQRFSRGSDIDLIIYGRENVARAKMFSEQVRATDDRFSGLTGKALESYS